MKCDYCKRDVDVKIMAHEWCLDLHEKRKQEGRCTRCNTLLQLESTEDCGECIRMGKPHVGYGLRPKVSKSRAL